ncbi:hypothetical protein ABIE35_003492 [Paenarthrobacter sp. 4246]
MAPASKEILVARCLLEASFPDYVKTLEEVV